MFPKGLKTLRIKRIFLFNNGIREEFDQEWTKDWNDIGKLVIYKGKRFEWFAYDPGEFPIDYQLIYGQTTKYDHVTPQEILSEAPSYECDCGGKKLVRLMPIGARPKRLHFMVDRFNKV